MRSVEELAARLSEKGGILRVADARLEGFTTHGIRRAIAEGAARRVRTRWLASPHCDPLLVLAARHGGRVSCLTAAGRLGLWTPPHDDIHLVVPSTASRIDAAGLRLHWSAGPMPVGASALVDPVINVLFHVARCAAPQDALAVWESAIRTKRIDVAKLRRIRWRSDRARALAEEASSLSDSGIETRFLILMRSIDVVVRQQVLLAGHPVDGLIGERLVVQLDGFAHHQAADRRRDLRHDAELALRGFTVLRFDYYQVLFRPEEVVTAVATAVAQGLHL